MKDFKIKRVGWGYEVIIEGKVAYTITKGGWGWNIYPGTITIRGLIDTAETYKEAKEMIRGW